MRVEKFEIPGEPMAKQRPKFARMGSFVKTYTPKETVNYEGLVRTSYGFQYKAAMHEGPVSLLVEAFVSAPKSLRKRDVALIQQNDRALPVLKKPDWDNIGKIISDALNGIAYRDDSQVFDGRAIKYYSFRPRVEVTITFHGEEQLTCV
jgi:Holliday junction resolvase RusA-like endonuclease